MIKRYDMGDIAKINLFEKVSHVKVKDAVFDEDQITFILDKYDVGRAIGKNASTINKLRSMFKRKIKLVGFDANVVNFIANLIKPLHAKEITRADDVITIVASDVKTRGLLIGRDKKNLKRLQNLVSRHFNVVIEVA